MNDDHQEACLQTCFQRRRKGEKLVNFAGHTMPLTSSNTEILAGIIKKAVLDKIGVRVAEVIVAIQMTLTLTERDVTNAINTLLDNKEIVLVEVHLPSERRRRYLFPLGSNVKIINGRCECE